MTNLKRILVLSSFALFSAAAPNAHAMLPVCQSASSDSDGDGYGWENNDSCIVNGAITPSNSGSGSASNSGANSGSSSRWPACLSAASDPDGDGFGWENNDTCLVTNNSSANSGSSAGSDNSAVLQVLPVVAALPVLVRQAILMATASAGKIMTHVW